MTEAVDPYRMIEQIPWVVDAMVDRCTEQGSCSRRVADSVRADVRATIERYLPQVREPKP